MVASGQPASLVSPETAERAEAMTHYVVTSDHGTSTVKAWSEQPSKDILQFLATNYGFAWADIAKMLNVSVPAIRKWRMHGGVSPDNHHKLAELAAFVQVLVATAQVHSPANWLLLRLVPGYTVISRDLYSSENAPLIVDYACENIAAEMMLDELVPDWRLTHRAEYEARQFDDGTMGLIRFTIRENLVSE